MGVIIGMDPHKRSATIEVIDERGSVLAAGRYGTDKAGYAEMLKAGRKFGERVWAIGGCNGGGRHIAHRLVADGETVLDVPAKLSAQVRVFAAGNGRKTDPVDAHSVALAALRSPNLVIVEVSPETGMRASTNTPTVVLVHGGFADSSYWVPVIEDLQAHDLPVLARGPAIGRPDIRYPRHPS